MNINSKNKVYMELAFLEYFYHDVQIKTFTFDFNQLDGRNSIIFLLCEMDDEENETYIDTKCTFTSVFDSYSSLVHNIRGNIFILEAIIDNTDEYLLDYKKNHSKFLTCEMLDSLNCYIIRTTNGEIKIISSKDVQISKVCPEFSSINWFYKIMRRW